MKTKVQYKFQIASPNNLKKLLKKAGVSLSAPSKHAYTYFQAAQSPNSAFAVLRLKVSGEKKALDMKIRNSSIGEWKHFETGITDALQAKNILIALGNKEIFTFRKNRQTYINNFIRLDLDTTKELGTFLEVKFLLKDKKKAETYLQQFGVNVAKPDKRSVIEIYKEKFGKK